MSIEGELIWFLKNTLKKYSPEDLKTENNFILLEYLFDFLSCTAEAIIEKMLNNLKAFCVFYENKPEKNTSQKRIAQD